MLIAKEVVEYKRQTLNGVTPLKCCQKRGRCRATTSKLYFHRELFLLFGFNCFFNFLGNNLLQNMVCQGNILSYFANNINHTPQKIVYFLYCYFLKITDSDPLPKILLNRFLASGCLSIY